MNEEDQLKDIAVRLRNSNLRKNYGQFLEACFATLNPATVYCPNWHIELIGEYLEACRQGEITRLIINMPPRALKSICVSVAWPAFLLGQNPSERIMTASYSSGLSVKHALDCRRVMQSQWYGDVFPDTMLARDQNEKHKFATTAFGHRIATSVGGTATGEGGNFLIMDDPQNPLQVMSDVQRTQASQWFDHTFATRLDDKRKGVIIVVMQRLHEADLSGHLLKKGGWEHLVLPAVAERTRIYDFGQVHKTQKRGELLHVAREDKRQIEMIRRELGSFAFAAQYQQNPLPLDTGMVKRHWFLRYDAPPETWDRVVQSWDTAIKTGVANDCSVCITFAEKEGRHYVLDVGVMREEYPQLKRMVLRYAKQWNADAVLIEDKASGQSLLQDLRKDKAAPPLIATLPKQDKVTRFAAVSAMIEAGQVVLPQNAVWLAELEHELLAFPQGRHDDQVDALSQYLAWIREAKKSQHSIRGL